MLDSKCQSLFVGNDEDLKIRIFNSIQNVYFEVISYTYQEYFLSKDNVIHYTQYDFIIGTKEIICENTIFLDKLPN